MNEKYMEKFPVNFSSETKVMKNGKIIVPNGELPLLNIVKKWKPFDSLLIALPDSKYFLPILNIEKFRPHAHKVAINRSRIGMLTIFAGMIMSIILAYVFKKPKMWTLAESFFGIGIFLLIDHVTVTRNIFALTERENYFFFLKKHSATYMVLLVVFMSLIGLVQLFIGGGKEDPDYCLLLYGAVFENIKNGEYWRLFTGAFIHASPTHWISNLVMLGAAGSLVGCISRIEGFVAFLIGCVAGNFASWIFSPLTHADACQGVSAGIMAIMGYCVAQSWKRPNSFPILFSRTISYFIVLNLYLAFVNNPQVSNEAHIAGVLAGVAWGLFSSGRFLEKR